MSLVTVLDKKILYKEYAMQFFVTMSFLCAIFMTFFIGSVNFDINLNLYLLLILKSVLLTAAYILLFKTYRHMEISSVEPLRNLSPIFLVIMAYFILGETISIVNIFGIFILIVGAYIVQVDHTWAHIFQNLKIFKNKNVDKVIISLFLVSGVAIIDKFLVRDLNPISIMFFTYWYMFIFAFIFFSFKYDGYHGIVSSIKNNNYWLLLMVVLQLSSDFMFYIAISIPGVLISLVIPIKRMSTLFATVIGGKMFHDYGLKVRIIGCCVAIVGVFFVVI